MLYPYNIEKARNVFDGTPSLDYEISVIDVDLISRFTSTQNLGNYSPIALKFEFKTVDDILVSINGSNAILIPAKTELELYNIWSFVLKTDNVEYYYFAQY